MSREDVANLAEAYLSGGPLPLAQDAVFKLEASGEVYEGRSAIEPRLSSVDRSHTVAARIYLPMDRTKSTLS